MKKSHTSSECLCFKVKRNVGESTLARAKQQSSGRAGASAKLGDLSCFGNIHDQLCRALFRESDARVHSDTSSY